VAKNKTDYKNFFQSNYFIKYKKLKQVKAFHLPLENFTWKIHLICHFHFITFFIKSQIKIFFQKNNVMSNKSLSL